MDLKAALEAHLTHLRVTLGRADITVTRRAGQLARFVDWMAEIGISSTEDLTASAVERYAQARLNTEPEEAARAGQRRVLAETTANLYKGHLRVFIAWLREEGLLEADQVPERKLVPKSKPKAARKKTFVHREEIHHYAAKAREWHPRNEAWVYFQHYMARRYSELARMRVRDLDLTPRPGFPFGCFVYDDTKGGRYNVKGQIDPEFAPIAKAWLEEYSRLIGRPLRPDDYLIPKTGPGKGAIIKGLRRPLKLIPSEPTTYAAVKDIMARAGLPPSHALRRGTGSHLTRRHGIRAAKTMLGHKDQKTTEIYIDIDQEVEDLGKLFLEDFEAAQGLPKPKAPSSGVVDLSDRRRRRLGPGYGTGA